MRRTRPARHHPAMTQPNSHAYTRERAGETTSHPTRTGIGTLTSVAVLLVNDPPTTVTALPPPARTPPPSAPLRPAVTVQARTSSVLCVSTSINACAPDARPQPATVTSASDTFAPPATRSTPLHDGAPQHGRRVVVSAPAPTIFTANHAVAAAGHTPPLHDVAFCAPAPITTVTDAGPDAGGGCVGDTPAAATSPAANDAQGSAADAPHVASVVALGARESTYTTVAADAAEQRAITPHTTAMHVRAPAAL